MAQVRQAPMRSLPDPGRLHASPSADLRGSQRLRTFEPPIIPRSPFHAAQTQSTAHPTSYIPAAPPRRHGSGSTLHHHHPTRYDSLTGLTRHPTEHESVPMPPPRSLEHLLTHPERTTSNLFEQTRLERQMREVRFLRLFERISHGRGFSDRRITRYARTGR